MDVANRKELNQILTYIQELHAAAARPEELSNFTDMSTTDPLNLELYEYKSFNSI